MTNPSLKPITPVELFISGYHMAGVSRQIDDSNRLTDLLNNAEETFFLRNVNISTDTGDAVSFVNELVVGKSAIIAATPRETHELLMSRRARRTGIPRPARTAVTVVAIAPPYVATGTAHIALPSERSQIELRSLPRFFPLTDVQLSLGSQSVYEGDLLLINRDAIASLGRIYRDVEPLFGDSSASHDVA